jgi:alcohol dehydrogenase class IV
MGRQLGPRFGIPHGQTSAILLPAVVELEAPRKSEAETRVAGALGAEPGQAAAALRRLVADLSLPGTLREAGITDRAAVEELFAGNSPAREVIALAW